MNITSAKKIEKHLNEYSIYLKYWDDEQFDSYEMLGARQVLQDLIEDFTDKQLEKLDVLDERAIELEENYHGNSDDIPVWSLRQCVELAHQKVELFA
jgi:hypothetical protein